MAARLLCSNSSLTAEAAAEPHSRGGKVLKGDRHRGDGRADDEAPVGGGGAGCPPPWGPQPEQGGRQPFAVSPVSRPMPSSTMAAYCQWSVGGHASRERGGRQRYYRLCPASRAKRRGRGSSSTTITRAQSAAAGVQAPPGCGLLRRPDAPRLGPQPRQSEAGARIRPARAGQSGARRRRARLRPDRARRRLLVWRRRTGAAKRWRAMTLVRTLNLITGSMIQTLRPTRPRVRIRKEPGLEGCGWRR